MSDDSDDIALSELQLDLLRVLWARGEASVAEVAEQLAATRGLAHTTVATLLTLFFLPALYAAWFKVPRSSPATPP